MTDKHKRPTTAIRFRADVVERLRKESAERDVSINFLVNKAVEEFLKNLLPLDEVRWTRSVRD